MCRNNKTQRTGPIYKVYYSTDLNLAFFNIEMLFKYIQNDTIVHWKVYGTVMHTNIYLGLLSG